MSAKKHPLLLSILLSISLLFSAIPAFAASDSGDKVPAALSPDAISALVSKMDEQQTDALVSLIEVLDSSVGDEKAIVDTEKAAMLDTIKTWGRQFKETTQTHFQEIPAMLSGVGTSIGFVFNSRGFSGSLKFFALLALMLGIAYGAELLTRRIFSSQVASIKNESADSLLGTLKILSHRALLQTIGIIVFWIAGSIAAAYLFTDPIDHLFVTTLLGSVIILIRLAAALLRFVLAPGRADLRLVSTDGQTARFLFRHMVIVTGIMGIGFFLVSLMKYHNIETASTLRYWVGLIAVVWLMAVTWKARDGLTSIIMGDDEENLTPGLQRMAGWWPKASIILIGLVWLLVQFIISTGNTTITPGRGVLMLTLIVILPFLDTMVRGIAAHLVPAMEGEGIVAETAYQDTRLSYVRIGRAFLFAFFIFAIAKLLGLNLRDLTAGMGTEIAANALAFLMILASGYLAIELVNLWINRRLVKEMPATANSGDTGDGGGAGKSRMATILPILRITLKITIVLLTVLLALSQIGVNTAPLLAGAGVLGLAIGFGAQTLVKDIVSGVFFLLDDAFRMGEYIDVGGTAGTVEKISIRSIQLRGAKGPVHIIPYGSMSKLTNLSRDWVIVKLRFTVPFDTDIDRVRRIFKKVGQQIMEIPEYKDDILAPFKSQGAADVTDVGIVIKGKFMTKPGGQWMVKREIYTRVQTMFKQYGIEFARKEIRVQMPEGAHEELSTDQKTAVAAAAGEAADTTPAPATDTKK